MILTGKKLVLYAAQKKTTVITAKYPPSTIPVVKISASFQLSGRGEGFTRSFDMVIMVPVDTRKMVEVKMKNDVYYFLPSYCDRQEG